MTILPVRILLTALLVGVVYADVCTQYCGVTIDSTRDLCPENAENPRPPNRVDTTQNLAALRATMKNQAQTGATGPLAAYLVYEGSYYGGGVTEHDRRMQWISGFSGSSGHVIVTDAVPAHSVPARAALWTDGRYYLQGNQEMDCDNWILMKEGVDSTPTSAEWLVDILPNNASVGAHPDFMDTTTWQEFESAFTSSNKGIKLVEVTADLFDYVWTEGDGRPPLPVNDVYVHTMEFTGKSWQDKVAEVKAAINGKADVLAVTLLDDIAWLFNLRGSDRETSPLFDSIGMVFQNEVRLYMRDVPGKLAVAEVRTHLNVNVDGTCANPANCVKVMDYDKAIPDIEAFAANSAINNIWINKGVSYAVYEAAGNKRHEDYSPIQLPKSQKNPTEVAKYRECQLRDSAHLVEFMAMLEDEMVNQGVTTWTELSAAMRLREYRARDPNFRMVSFFSISAIGPNGAVIHYRPTNSTDTPLTTSQMYLLDSGGNYLDGTTDVTRTFHFGTPTDREIEAYTRVLMGVIDLATTVWPFGLKGSDIDARTRTPLWQNGWDFNHGTGHGIGFFLNVHEGPGRISLGWRASVKPLYEHQFYSDGPGRINMGHDESHEPLHEHMFFSDEPGYYEDGAFGVRLETIVEVVKANTPNTFNDKEYLTFDPVTLVPFEPNLINYDMLETHHRVWLNAYHTKVEQQLGDYLQNVANNQAAYDWMKARTAMLPEVPNFTGSAPSYHTSGAVTMVTTLLALLLAVLA